MSSWPQDFHSYSDYNVGEKLEYDCDFSSDRAYASTVLSCDLILRRLEKR